MQFRRQPNRWSCAVAAAAMVMDIEIDKLIEHIGHDGSEIVHPDLPYPICHAGFDMQEIIDVALRYGWSVTPVEARPHLTNDGVHTRELFTDPEQICERMTRYFDSYSGIVAGMRLNSEWYHNVAWDHESQTWLDPSGPVLPREQPPIKIAVFWIFQKTLRSLISTSKCP